MIVAVLLERGADPNYQDSEGNTPLHWASEYDHTDIVSLLCTCGASLSTENDRGVTPAQLAQLNEASDTTLRLLSVPISKASSSPLFSRLKRVYDSLVRS